MSARVPLPPGLLGRAFSVREGYAQGVGRHRMLGGDLARPFHGARVPPAAPQGLTFEGLARAYERRAPATHFLSHSSAALLWDVPLPRRLQQGPLHVSVLAPTAAPRSRAVTGHRLRDADLRVELRRGLRVVDAATAWCQLGAILGHDDLVAAADHLVLEPYRAEPGEARPYVTFDALTARAASYSAPGAAALRRALADVRPGAESRPETHLRLLIARDGLPEPELAAWVDGSFAIEGGRHFRVDLLYRRHGVIVEYDGEQHRTDDVQYDRDLRRLESLREAEWAVVVVRRRGLYGDPGTLLARIRSALTRGRPPAP
ncbi:DUF559 domain-containing protein [Herbiconiux sp. CPCC 205716]|uniref:DUF559 domain-containing protein n=1 Tax=Herbiconiux gentiana TaxID=2970912 RepID=A0ABT2GI39_9MICO|nr:DUF559 domain-containing protein [Herbiconiux gentiana]MCS5714451.1 DUF559 domain-containing protein [Herbiconiux gentiana]